MSARVTAWLAGSLCLMSVALAALERGYLG
jgi:hypothetical protein